MKSKCAFCGESKEEDKLIRGKDGSICADCSDMATEYFHEQTGIDSINHKEKELEELNTEERVEEFLSLNKLKDELDKKVIGQENAKRQLLIEFYKHYKGIQDVKNNAFLVGDSGVGKTHLVRSLAQVFDIRLVEFDATMFSETGYKGKDVLDIIGEAYHQCGEDVEVLKKSVIFIDEIDKVLTTTNAGGESKIQQSLLKMVEGIEVPLRTIKGRKRETVMINTRDLQFVVAGACVGLKEQKTSISSPKIGFGHKAGKEEEASKEITSEDLIKFGFIPEFVGRFPLIVQLESLTKEDYVNILKNSEKSVIKDYIHVFQQENIILEVDEGAMELMAEQVQDSQLGFRGVQSALTRHLNEMLYDSIALNRTRIVLDRNSLINDDNS